MKKTTLVSLKTQMIIISTILVLFCTGVIGGYILLKLPSITIHSVGGDYLTILKSISKIIDIEELENLKSSDVDGEYYKKLDNELLNTRNTIGLEHLYLLKKINGNDFIVLEGKRSVDSTTGATVQAGEGEEGVSSATANTDGTDGVSQATIKGGDTPAYVTDTMKASFLGEEKFELQDNSQWGKLFSIYLPLKNDRNETVGVLIANFKGDAIYREFNLVRDQIITLVIVILAVGMLIAILFSRYISKRIVHIKNHVEKMEQGDFSERIKIHQKDEIGVLGTSMNKMADTWSEILTKIDQISNSLKGDSGELASISENIAMYSVETTASVSEIVQGVSAQENELAHIKEVLQKFNDLVSSVHSSLHMAKEQGELTEGFAKEGDYQLQNLIQSITSSLGSFDKVLEQVDILNVEIGQINAMNEVIQSISKSTNLLALNASIEAARAGEAGRGFSIVAEEIRKLADQSKDSTDSISQVVNVIMEQVSEVASTSLSVKEKFTKQYEYIEHTNKAFQSITQSLESSIPAITKAFDKADDMIESKNFIVERVGYIAEVSGETTASANEILSAAEYISDTTHSIVDAAKTMDTLSGELLEESKKFIL